MDKQEEFKKENVSNVDLNDVESDQEFIAYLNVIKCKLGKAMLTEDDLIALTLSSVLHSYTYKDKEYGY